jgi:hypothetical protein
MNGGWLLFFTVVFVVIWGIIFYRKYDKIENNRIFIILLYFIPVITALKFSCAKNPIDFLVYGYKIPAKEEGKKIFLKILKEKEKIFDYQQEPVIWTKVDKKIKSVSYEVVFKKIEGNYYVEITSSVPSPSRAGIEEYKSSFLSFFTSFLPLPNTIKKENSIRFSYEIELKNKDVVEVYAKGNKFEISITHPVTPWWKKLLPLKKVNEEGWYINGKKLEDYEKSLAEIIPDSFKKTTEFSSILRRKKSGKLFLVFLEDNPVKIKIRRNGNYISFEKLFDKKNMALEKDKKYVLWVDYKGGKAGLKFIVSISKDGRYFYLLYPSPLHNSKRWDLEKPDEENYTIFYSSGFPGKEETLLFKESAGILTNYPYYVDGGGKLFLQMDFSEPDRLKFTPPLKGEVRYGEIYSIPSKNDTEFFHLIQIVRYNSWFFVFFPLTFFFIILIFLFHNYSEEKAFSANISFLLFGYVLLMALIRLSLNWKIAVYYPYNFDDLLVFAKIIIIGALYLLGMIYLQSLFENKIKITSLLRDRYLFLICLLMIIGFGTKIYGSLTGREQFLKGRISTIYVISFVLPVIYLYPVTQGIVRKFVLVFAVFLPYIIGLIVSIIFDIGQDWGSLVIIGGSLLWMGIFLLIENSGRSKENLKRALITPFRLVVLVAMIVLWVFVTIRLLYFPPFICTEKVIWEHNEETGINYPTYPRECPKDGLSKYEETFSKWGGDKTKTKTKLRIFNSFIFSWRVKNPLNKFGTPIADETYEELETSKIFTRLKLKDSPWSGSGYLSIHPLGEEKDKEESYINDHTLYYLLLPEYGLLGVISLILLFFFIPLLLMGSLFVDRMRMEGSCRGVILFILVYLMFSAFYIMGHESFLFPFTGINLPYLSPASGSNILEWSILTILLMIGYGRRA